MLLGLACNAGNTEPKSLVELSRIAGGGAGICASSGTVATEGALFGEMPAVSSTDISSALVACRRLCGGITLAFFPDPSEAASFPVWSMIGRRPSPSISEAVLTRYFPFMINLNS